MASKNNVKKLTAEIAKNGTVDSAAKEPQPGYTFPHEGGDGTPAAVLVPIRKTFTGLTYGEMSKLVTQQNKAINEGKPDTPRNDELKEIKDAAERLAFIAEHSLAIQVEAQAFKQWEADTAERDRMIRLEYDYRFFLAALDYSDFRVQDKTIPESMQKALQAEEKHLDTDVSSAALLMDCDLREVRRIGGDFRKDVGV